MRFSTDFAEIVLANDVRAAAKFYKEVVGPELNKPTDDGDSLNWALSV